MSERRVSTMTDIDGLEVTFSVQTAVDGVARVILRAGAARGARLDDEKQAEFLRHFLGAQLACGQPEAPDPLVMPADELAALRTALEHAQAALAGDNEGVRLWMLDCGELVAKHRTRAEAAEAKLTAITDACRSIPSPIANRILAITGTEEESRG